jgi:exopolyphosphatase/guanosine-5'-triphosphate,3'-diphosphate pyrophosphatase
VHVLSSEEEARLCFVGATRTLATAAESPVAVIDVGGGSTEVAVGDPKGGVSWSESRKIGSGSLADAYLRSDPPSAPELAAVRRHVADVFEGLAPPTVESALAVGGTATSLRRLAGGELSHETLERATGTLARSRVGELAERFDLDPERVRLLPAGILVLEALSDRLRVPLTIARGGLREGVILELFDSYG